MRPDIVDQSDSMRTPGLREYAERVLGLAHPQLLCVLDVHVSQDGRWRLCVQPALWRPLRLAEVAERIHDPAVACSLVMSVVEALRYLHSQEFRGASVLQLHSMVSVAQDEAGQWRLALRYPRPSEAGLATREEEVVQRRVALAAPVLPLAGQVSPEADSWALGELLSRIGVQSIPSLLRLAGDSLSARQLLDAINRSQSPDSGQRLTLEQWRVVLQGAGGQPLPSIGDPQWCVPQAIEPASGYRRVLGVCRRRRQVARAWVLRRGSPDAASTIEPSLSTRELQNTAQSPSAAADTLDSACGASSDGAGAEQAAPLADEVDCSVYAPRSVYAGDLFAVQAFFHLPGRAEEAERMALRSDASAQGLGVGYLEVEVQRGSRLQSKLVLPEADIDEPVQDLLWRGRTASVTFGVGFPERSRLGGAMGRVEVMLNGMPVGRVKFRLTVKPADPAGTRLPPEKLGRGGQRYRKAFISYASPDRSEVLKRVQMLEQFGVEFFQDLLSLKPGQLWEQELYSRIDECDLFLLFWSQAAKDSEWVEREVAYALRLQGLDPMAPPEILPVILEGPPVPAPPDNLRHLHFNDRLIYFLHY